MSFKLRTTWRPSSGSAHLHSCSFLRLKSEMVMLRFGSVGCSVSDPVPDPVEFLVVGGVFSSCWSVFPIRAVFPDLFSAVSLLLDLFWVSGGAPFPDPVPSSASVPCSGTFPWMLSRTDLFLVAVLCLWVLMTFEGSCHLKVLLADLFLIVGSLVLWWLVGGFLVVC